MRTLRLFILLFSLVTLSIAAEPLRVAVPPASYYDSLTVPEQHYSIPLLLHLHDRFAEMPGVTLADPAWTGALLGEFAGGKRTVDEPSLFTEFAARLPVDAIVRVMADADELRCVVLTAQGAHTEKFPLSRKPDVQAVCESAAAYVAKTLALGPGDARILTERRLKSAAQFEALLLARRVSVRYPNSIAEARMTLLQKFAGTPDANEIEYALGVVEGMRTISNGRATSASAVQRGTDMAKRSVMRLLDTPYAERAHPILRELSAAFEPDLLALVKPLSGNSLDLVLDGAKARKDGDLLLESGGAVLGQAPTAPGANSAIAQVTVEQRLAALRCLGVMENDKALATIRLVIKNEDPRYRTAAAEALHHYTGRTGLDLLETLSADQDSKVAFAASQALWKRSQSAPPPPGTPAKKTLPGAKGTTAPTNATALSPEEVGAAADRGLKLARQFIDDQNDPRRNAARLMVCALGTREDSVALAAWSISTDTNLRSLAVEALVRVGAIAHDRWPTLLRDPAASVVTAALGGIPKAAEPAAVTRVTMLANDPFAPVAQAARLACARYRPEDARARLNYDLAIEHPYIRRRLIDRLAADPAPAALDDLTAAGVNSDPHTRSYALARLAEREPARARAALVKAIADPYHWVRLHAAAQLATLATSAEAGSLRQAQASEHDAATKLYLADALAKAEGKPAPAPAATAYSVAGKSNLAWSCSAGEGCETSPFGAYYLLGAEKVSERLQRAHAAGKILFARVNPIGNAGTIMTDLSAMDGFWLNLQSELTADNLPHLDGLVYGEESMTATTEPLWKNGWPLFCFDAGLDPEKVRGSQANLSPSEARAWTDWALTQTVEGFNVLYDYTKLRFGKLRPGLQVCTFLPGQGATGPADRRWKFDVGGIYDYKGNNRVAAYTLIRRMKTLWPDRPVLWLSLGIGGYEMNPVRYTQKTPEAPMTTRADRAYADSVTAWLAGADTGWFSTWIFIAADAKATGMAGLRGTQIVVEDILPGSQKLKAGIASSFGKAGKILEAKSQSQGPGPKIDDSKEEKVVELAVEDLFKEKKNDGNPITKQLDQDMERMRIGFHFYGKYVYDCARVFASLPRLNPKPAALAVKPGLSVWSRGADFASAGHNLLNAYDFLLDVNQVPETDLPRYRLIALDGLDKAPLADRTIASLSSWLKKQPGLLYVRGTLSTDPANEASTAADHDGILKERWPWTGQVDLGATGYKVSGPNTTILAQGAQGPLLVLWRAPEHQGAVLFDAGTKDAAELRETINKLAREKKVGMELTGPPLQTIWQQPGMLAASSSGGSIENVVHGVDLLTGARNPVVGPGRNGALAFANLGGKYAASMNGVAVLGETPLVVATPVEGGIRVHCTGLLQASSQGGELSVAVEGENRLPIVEPGKFNDWVLFGKEEGFCIRQFADSPTATPTTITYIRSSHPVVITSKKID